MSERDKIELTVLEVVRASNTLGCTPRELHDKLQARGAAVGQIRDAVSRLWDEGEIRLGADRKIRINE